MNEIQRNKYTPPSRAIGFRAPLADYPSLVEKAEAAGLKVGQFCLAAAKGTKITPPVPAINRQLYADLGRVGSNINQIARKLNSENRLSGSDLVAALNSLSESLAETRRQLIGAK